MVKVHVIPSFLTLFAGLAVCSSLIAAEPSSNDWPQWRGPNRDNKSSQKHLISDWASSKPKLAWQMEGIGLGYGSVAIVGDRLFTIGSFDAGEGELAVMSIDLKTQKIVWKTAIATGNFKKGGYDGSRSTPTVDGALMYVTGSNGQITCLETDSGKIVWSKDFAKEWGGKLMSGWGFSESPLVDGDRVLCTPGSSKAMIVALDKKTGDEIWRSNVEDAGDAGKSGAGYSSIVISNGAGVKQYVTLIGRGLIGVRASDGKHLWSYNKITNGTAAIPTAIVQGDYVFGSSGYRDGGSGLVKLVKNGEGVDAVEQYYKPGNDLQNHHGGMVLIGDHLYFGHGHNNGFPVCVDMVTGDVKWRGNSRDIGSGSAAITYADGHIVFRYQKGMVALVEATPTEFKLKGTFTPATQHREAWAHPVICQGKLFLRDQGTLMCYQVAKD